MIRIHLHKGKRIVIPFSYTGGARYMLQHYLDAMTTCKYMGFPGIFITFACNPEWPEITRYLKRHNLMPEDRPDLCCRVFKMKLDDLIYQLRKKHVLGVADAVIYTIDFQERGLPHAHIVLFMRGDHKLPTADICNRDLSLRYSAHINVEWCVQSRSVKYLFKYIHKGSDYVRVAVEGEIAEDEIKKHFSCRYISACESTWRILFYPIHYRSMPVTKLPFHLPGQQLVIFNENDPAEEVFGWVTNSSSKFFAWMECDKLYPDAKLQHEGVPNGLMDALWKLEGKGMLLKVVVTEDHINKTKNLFTVEKLTHDGVMVEQYREEFYTQAPITEIISEDNSGESLVPPITPTDGESNVAVVEHVDRDQVSATGVVREDDAPVCSLVSPPMPTSTKKSVNV